MRTMGCEVAKPHVVTITAEEPEGEATGFSETQIDTIRSTWPLLSRQAARVGLEVFTRIFREAPTIHILFGHYKIYNLDDLSRSATFREHAVRFMTVIDGLVEELESPHSVDQPLHLLGAKHAAFDGYHPEYFRFYTKCMMEVWETELGEEFIPEVRDSWRAAFDYIVDRMTEGFDMCLSGQIQEVLDGSIAQHNPWYSAALGDGSTDVSCQEKADEEEGEDEKGVGANSSHPQRSLFQKGHNNDDSRGPIAISDGRRVCIPSYQHEVTSDGRRLSINEGYQHEVISRGRRFSIPSYQHEVTSKERRLSVPDYQPEESDVSGTGGFGDVRRNSQLHLTVEADYGLARVQ